MSKISYAKWQDIAISNRHLLTGNTWRSPAGKVAFTEAMLAAGASRYLWYAWPRTWNDWWP